MKKLTNLNFRRSIAALGLTIALGIPIYLFTQPSHAQEIGDPGNALQQLNLSNDQLQQIKAIRARNHGEIKSNRQRLRQLQQELQAMMAGSDSSDRVRAKFNELQSTQQQVARLQFEQMLAMRQVLNPQQRSQLAQIAKQRRENRRPHR